MEWKIINDTKVLARKQSHQEQWKWVVYPENRLKVSNIKPKNLLKVLFKPVDLGSSFSHKYQFSKLNEIFYYVSHNSTEGVKDRLWTVVYLTENNLSLL